MNDLEADESSRDQRLTKAESALAEIRHALGLNGRSPLIPDDKLADHITRLQHRCRDSEESFRRTFACSSVPQAVLAPNGRYVQTNDAFCELIGYSREEILQMKPLDIIHPDDLPHHIQWRDLISGKIDQYTAHRRYCHKQGKVIFVENTVTAIRSEAGDVLQAVSHIQDKTEQTLALNALRESELRLKHATQSAGIGVWEWDVESDRLIWSEEMSAIYGGPAEPFIGRHEDWQKHIHPDDVPRALSRMTKAIAGEDDLHTDYRIFRADGELRYIESHAQVTRDSKGDPSKFFGVNIDVTDARLAAENLRREERFRRQMTETAPVGIFVWDVEKNCLKLANQQYLEIIGYTMDEAKELGPRLLDALYHPEAKAQLEAYDRKLFSDRTGAVFDMEYRVINKSGEEIWCHTRETVLTRNPDGSPSEILGASQEITEQKKSQLVLEQREQISRALVEESQGLVKASAAQMDVAIDHLLARVGELSAADRCYVFIFEGKSGEVTMTNTHEWCAAGIEPQITNLQRIPVEASPNLARLIMSGDNANFPDVAKMPEDWVEDRELLEVQGIKSIYMMPLISGQNVIGFTGFDAVTHCGQWTEEQQRLLRIMSDLIAAVLHRRKSDEEKTALLHELTLAKEHAEAASRAKDEFLAVVSHELRTPLNPILGFGEILLDFCTGDPEKEYVETIIQAGERQLKLINSILSYSRLDKMATTPELTECYLLPIFRDALNDVRPIAHSLKLEFQDGGRWQPLEEDLHVVTDPGMLRQLLDNLLSNACKYTRQGKITLTAGIEKLADDQSGFTHKICFSVEDTGIGIGPDLKENIFDPFTQADSSHSRQFEGAGLGLAICKKLCDTLGGEIGFESELGEGTLFWVELPVRAVADDPADTSATSDVVAPDAAFLDQCRVLIVDDRPDNSALLRTLIRRGGGLPEVANTGEAALEAAARTEFKVILMDLAMPGMDGFEVTAAIRASQGPNADTPILAVSADVSENVRQRCLENGMEDFLPKPVDRESLYNILRPLCNRPRRSRQ